MQTGFNISQAFMVRQLRECHNTELLRTRKALDAEIALISIHAPMECLQRHEVHNLGKNHLA
jgi:hypothetical protein